MGPNGAGKSTLSAVVMGKPGLRGARGLGHARRRRRARHADVGAGRGRPPPRPAVPDRGARRGPRRHAARGARGPRRRRRRRSSELLRAEAARDRVRAERLLHRALNVDLSGGEKKRNETLQLAMLQPRIAILDELDSGLDIDALRACARRIEALTKPSDGRPGPRRAGDHALQPAARRAAPRSRCTSSSSGRIVAEGGPELADQLEADGYAAFAADDAAEPDGDRARSSAPAPSTSCSPTPERGPGGRRSVAAMADDRPGWEERDGALHRHFEFDDFSAAFAFMTRVALLAERAATIPDWSNSWNKVDITLRRTPPARR